MNAYPTWKTIMLYGLISMVVVRFDPYTPIVVFLIVINMASICI